MSEERVNNMKRLKSEEKLGKKSKAIKNKSQFRNTYEKLLGKLNDNATMESGFKELQNIIKENKSSEDLRIYINSLSSYLFNCTINAKERIVLLLGYVASVYKEDLIDPLEKDLISTIKKILEIIKQFMKENSFGIHLACSNTIIELLNCYLISNLDNKEQIIQIFFNPLLETINSGASKYAQSAAIICLSDLCKNLNQEKSILQEIYPKLISFILKKKNIVESNYLFSCLYTILESLELNFYFNDLKDIIIKLEEILESNSNNLIKVECCKCLEMIGLRLVNENEDITCKYFDKDIIKALQFSTKDRNSNVVSAANKALKAWQELQKKTDYNDKINDKTERNKDINSKSQSLSKLNFVKQLSKLNKCSTPEMVREEIYSKGITNLLRTSDFLNKNKKNTMFQTATKFFVNKERLKSFLGVSKRNDKSKSNDQKEQHKNNSSLHIENSYKIPQNENINLINDYSSINKGKKSFSDLQKTVLSLFDSLCVNLTNEFNDRLDLVQKRLENLEGKIGKLKSIKEHTINRDNLKKFHNISQENITHNPDLKSVFKIEKNSPIERIPSNEKTPKETEVIHTETKVNTFEKQDSEINKLWKETIHNIKLNNINLAYSRLLTSNDDLYLLRLVFLTGPVLNMLSIENSKNLLRRMNLISRSHQIENLIYSIIQQSYDLNIFLYLNEDFQNSVLDTLYEYSMLQDTEIGIKSRRLYSIITSNPCKG